MYIARGKNVIVFCANLHFHEERKLLLLLRHVNHYVGSLEMIISVVSASMPPPAWRMYKGAALIPVRVKKRPGMTSRPFP
jgi:hypothetical protein